MAYSRETVGSEASFCGPSRATPSRACLCFWRFARQIFESADLRIIDQELLPSGSLHRGADVALKGHEIFDEQIGQLAGGRFVGRTVLPTSSGISISDGTLGHCATTSNPKVASIFVGAELNDPE